MYFAARSTDDISSPAQIMRRLRSQLVRSSCPQPTRLIWHIRAVRSGLTKLHLVNRQIAHDEIRQSIPHRGAMLPGSQSVLPLRLFEPVQHMRLIHQSQSVSCPFTGFDTGSRYRCGAALARARSRYVEDFAQPIARPRFLVRLYRIAACPLAPQKFSEAL